ncbi:MAG: Trk family potassium uptake protein [Clostridia bacterium]|nr:Trk family potassium uptake protein [Clostridia bacterium]
MLRKIIKKISRTRLIAIGFFAVIFIGSILLMLPFATKDGQTTSYIDALFTATSATCVTGLVPFDTFTHWTLFGQLVILFMIQLGGIGFMTVITMATLFMRHKIGLQNRMLIMESAGTISLSGIGELVRRIVFGTAVFETLGALILATRFIPKFGLLQGIYFSIFHSISAFCNAGFDLMGTLEPGSSMILFNGDAVVMLTLTMLILTGGIGFFVWNDILVCKARFKKYQMHTKLVLTATAIITVASTAMFFIFEYDGAFEGMNFFDMVINSLFQSVTPRTAGFSGIDMTTLSEPGSILTMVLMFIGGSPGSTAGGVKTTTVAVILISTLAYLQEDNNVTIFKKRIEEKMVRRACSIAFIYFSMIFICSMVISFAEPVQMKEVLFEVISAVATVGLSMNLTATLSFASKAILIVLMYAGRLGALTFIMMLSKRDTTAILKRPVGKIMIG